MTPTDETAIDEALDEAIDEAIDGGRARNFDAMDVRETQEALAEELEAMVDEDTPAQENLDALEQDAADAVWSAAQMAEHLRMAEALLFAAVEPLDEEAIAARLPEGADITTLIETLTLQYENRGVVLSKAAGKYRFVTAPDVAHVLEKEKIEPRKLTRAALETLAIIAYHQPCTRADIEDVRGVAVSPGSLDQLMEIGWIRMRGRRRTAPGRPILYGTTQSFLEHFNLESVTDLPGMADLKAAGLLDARLPPGFTIPAPSDEIEGEDADDDGDEAEFVTDFHESDEVTDD
ncbi:MAG: SMC-Scp complex subunit ScpB [Parvularculaceae bacterium]|nr:SMC-Scp complex subunit ScpB [Parvularculaceae bacterium]